MCILSVKLILVNLQHMLSDEAEFNKQSRSLLTNFHKIASAIEINLSTKIILIYSLSLQMIA